MITAAMYDNCGHVSDLLLSASVVIIQVFYFGSSHDFCLDYKPVGGESYLCTLVSRNSLVVM